MAIYAQGQTGVKVLEGSVSYFLSNSEDYDFYYQQTDEYKRQQFNINPKMGWFISESSVLGVGIAYSFYKFEGESESKTHLFSINPYYRNYQKITDKLFYTTTIHLALGFGKDSYRDDSTRDLFVYSLNVSPGISYFLSDKWALKTSFGSLFYRRTNAKITEGSEGERYELKDSEFGFNFSMDSYSLGIAYYF